MQSVVAGNPSRVDQKPTVIVVLLYRVFALNLVIDSTLSMIWLMMQLVYVLVSAITHLRFGNYV